MNEKKLVRKLVGEEKTEAMVQRLDRLTQEEARQTVTQILKVVHGLVEFTKVIMGGKQIHHGCHLLGTEDLFLQTVRYRLTISRKPSVKISGHNQVTRF